MIDGALIVMTVVVVGLVAAAWWRGGSELVGVGLGGGAGLLWRYALLIALSFLAAGLAEALVPRAWIQQGLGAQTGVRGLVLAAVAGALTPSGPFIALPIAASLVRTGAGAGPVVAYVTGWSLLALHRLVAWELPLLGPRLALLRWAICLVVPVLAGLLARALTRS